MKFLKNAFLLTLGGGLLLTGALQAQAAPQSVGVRPLKTEITLDPGQTKEVTLEVINRLTTDTTVIPSIEAYTANTEEGFPAQGEVDSNDPQNVLNWIQISKNPVTIPAEGKKDVKFKVTAPSNAQPGGRYAAIFYEPVTDKVENGVQVKTRVASLLLVTVSGDVIENGSLSDFGLNFDELSTDKPLQFQVKFTNNGTVHVKPVGKIELFDGEGEIVAQVGKVLDKNGNVQIVDYIPVNPNLGNVLPGSTRIFTPEWKDPRPIEGLTAALTLNYGQSAQELKTKSPIDFKAGASVSDFAFDPASQTFSFDLTNDGNIALRPQFKVKILNDFDYQVDEIVFDEEGYLKSGETRAMQVTWDKEIPDGKYTAQLAFVSPLLADVTPTADFRVGGYFTASIFSAQTIPVLAVILLLGGGGAYLYTRKKQAK